MTTKAPLPLFTIEPNSVVVATNVGLSEAYVKKLIQDAHTYSVFGFGMQLTPSSQVRLVQIASDNTVYIFDINKISFFPTVLHTFLSNPAYVKIGSGVLGHAKALANSDEVELAGAGELSRLHRMYDLSGAISGVEFASCVELDTLSQLWLRRGLSNHLQPAQQWIGKLSEEQYIYAATNAAVTLAIYRRMMTVDMLRNARPRLWISTGYEACSSELIGLVKEYAPYTAMSTRYITSMEQLLADMKKTHQDADDTLGGDDFDTWTEKTIPEAVQLCVSLTKAFDLYKRQISGRSS